MIGLRGPQVIILYLVKNHSILPIYPLKFSA
jgi:hypothetical protein